MDSLCTATLLNILKMFLENLSALLNYTCCKHGIKNEHRTDTTMTNLIALLLKTRINCEYENYFQILVISMPFLPLFILLSARYGLAHFIAFHLSLFCHSCHLQLLCLVYFHGNAMLQLVLIQF